MNFIHEVINYLASQPASTWTTLGSYLGGSTLVATILQIAKHRFNFAGASKVVVFALGFFSFLAAFADLLLQANVTNPLPQLGHVTGLLMAGAVVIHRFAVSPVYYRIAGQLQKLVTLFDEVNAQKKKDKAVAAVLVGTAVPVTSQLPDEANLAQFQL